MAGAVIEALWLVMLRSHCGWGCYRRTMAGSVNEALCIQLLYGFCYKRTDCDWHEKPDLGTQPYGKAELTGFGNERRIGQEKGCVAIQGVAGIHEGV